MAQFLHVKTDVCSFLVKTWSIMKRDSTKRSCSSGAAVCLLKTHRKTAVPEYLFDEIVGLQSGTLLKNRPRRRCFAVNFTRFFKNLFHRILWCFCFWILKPSHMSRYHNKDMKTTSITAMFLITLPTLKIFFLCWDNLGSHHPEQVCEITDIFKGNTSGGVQLYFGAGQQEKYIYSRYTVWPLYFLT